MILSPYFWIAMLLAAITFFGTGYHNGYKHANDHAEALKLQAVAKAQAEAESQAKADQQTAQNYETTRETVRTVYVQIKEKAHENITKNPDYSGCGLDGDGLRLYNNNPSHPAPAPPRADGTLPGSATRSERQAVNDSEQQPGALTNVLRLPGSPQGTVGLGDIASSRGG